MHYLGQMNEIFFLVTSQIPFFHIIGHSLGRSKPFNVHVNQQANIGPKLLCLLHSLKNPYSCLHKYSFTFSIFYV